MAPQIRDGIYSFAIGASCLTLHDSQAPAQLISDGEVKHRDTQKASWHVENGSDGKVTLKNVKTGQYLGIAEGELHVMQPLQGSDRPVEFAVDKVNEYMFKLRTLVDSQKTFLSTSPILIYPPMIAVVPEPMAHPGWIVRPIE